MRVFTTDGQTVIDHDEDVVSMAASVDMELPYWEYEVEEIVEGVRSSNPVTKVTKTVRVDVTSHRPNTEVLGNLYQHAQSSKLPEDAAAYVKHKERVLDLFHKRDVLGERYEN